MKLRFDNLVLDFSRKPAHFGSWSGNKIILRIGEAGQWSVESLFPLCLATINHECIHGVISDVMMPKCGYMEGPPHFDPEWPMAYGIDFMDNYDLRKIIPTYNKMLVIAYPLFKNAPRFYDKIIK